jgi:hypothetical protein
LFHTVEPVSGNFCRLKTATSALLRGPSAGGFPFDLSHSYTLPMPAAANVAAAVIVAATSKAHRFIAH